MAERRPLTRFAWLSIGAACLTIGLKAGAYLVTGSVGLLSDALESLVNLAAAIVALVALTIAAREPHEEHPFGYENVTQRHPASRTAARRVRPRASPARRVATGSAPPVGRA